MISAETIALVKERTDLVALIGESVRLTRRGRSFLGLCPFHKEKSPSFNVNAERGLYYCFGCKEHGSAVDFVMKTEGYTFPEAIRLLAERAGLEVGETQTDAERREANAAKKAREDLYAVSNLAALFFEQCLRGGPGQKAHPLAHFAVQELTKRGLPLPEPGVVLEGEAARIGDTLQAFRIGYAPFGWDGLAGFLKQQGISPLVGEKVGLLVQRNSGSGHYDRFRHRLMFAVSDVMGRVIAFSGRVLPDPGAEELAALRLSGPSAPQDGPPAKYINSPESPIYIKGEHLFGLHQARQAIRQQDEAVLVEGNFDVVSLHAHGQANVVAPLGTAFTAPQARLIKRFAPKVIVLFDGDAAGKKATEAARPVCQEAELDARVASLPDGLDPDELVRKRGKQGLEQLLKSARGMREHVISDRLNGERFRGASIQERRLLVKEVNALLAQEHDPNLRGMVKTYADQLSSRLIVHGKAPADLRELELELEREVFSSSKPEPLAASQVAVPHEQARSRVQVDEIAQAVLGALLDFPELFNDHEVTEALEGLEGDTALAVGALRQHFDREASMVPRKERSEDVDQDKPTRMGIYSDEFLAQIPRSVHSFAVGRVAAPEFEVLADAKLVLLDNARKLKCLGLKREKAAVVEELTQKAEAQGDVESEDALLREVGRLAMEKRGRGRGR